MANKSAQHTCILLEKMANKSAQHCKTSTQAKRNCTHLAMTRASKAPNRWMKQYGLIQFWLLSWF